MSAEQNKQVVRRFIDEVINSGQGESLQELTDAEYTLHFPGRPEPVTWANFADFSMELGTAFPDWHVEIDDMVAEDDKVAIIGNISGTHRGPFQGMPATNKGIKVLGIAVLQMRGGKILTHRVILDRLTILAQLGLLPEQPPAG